jgi:uncharacterized membrane-anchored protein
MGALLAVALFTQLRTRRYTPWIYWLTVVLVSVVGTQITDLLTDGLGVSLYISTSAFAVARRDLLCLVSSRTYPVHPRHRDAPPGAVLLVSHPLHICAGHRCR